MAVDASVNSVAFDATVPFSTHTFIILHSTPAYACALIFELSRLFDRSSPIAGAGTGTRLRL